MSNFTLRSRKIDADRPLLIVHEPLDQDEVETYGKNGYILRGDSELLVGMTKQEQEECHLKEKLKKRDAEIPTPSFRVLPDYETERDLFPLVRTSAYLRYRPSELECLRTEYDLDEEDEQWIEEMAHATGVAPLLPSLNEERLEFLIDCFEQHVAGPDASWFSAADACDLVLAQPIHLPAHPLHDLRHERDILCSLIRAVYDYWKHKRERKGKPLLRRFQPPPSETNPYAAFIYREEDTNECKRLEGMRRARDRRQWTAHQTLHVMRQLRKEFLQLRLLLDTVILRERLKREKIYVLYELISRQMQGHECFELLPTIDLTDNLSFDDNEQEDDNDDNEDNGNFSDQVGHDDLCSVVDLMDKHDAAIHSDTTKRNCDTNSSKFRHHLERSSDFNSIEISDFVSDSESDNDDVAPRILWRTPSRHWNNSFDPMDEVFLPPPTLLLRIGTNMRSPFCGRARWGRGGRLLFDRFTLPSARASTSILRPTIPSLSSPSSATQPVTATTSSNVMEFPIHRTVVNDDSPKVPHNFNLKNNCLRHSSNSTTAAEMLSASKETPTHPSGSLSSSVISQLTTFPNNDTLNSSFPKPKPSHNNNNNNNNNNNSNERANATNTSSKKTVIIRLSVAGTKQTSFLTLNGHAPMSSSTLS